MPLSLWWINYILCYFFALSLLPLLFPIHFKWRITIHTSFWPVLCCLHHIPDLVECLGRGRWMEGHHGCSLWVWWSLEFKGITATEWLGETPGRGGVWETVCLCESELESARPAHLNPVPFNPPTQSQLTSCSVLGPNPHILQPSPGHKLPFSFPPPFPSALHLHSLFTCYANHHHHTNIVSFTCPISVIVSWRWAVDQQCAPFLDKPFKICVLGQLITAVPQGTFCHQSSFVIVQAKCSAFFLVNEVCPLDQKCTVWLEAKSGVSKYWPMP